MRYKFSSIIFGLFVLLSIINCAKRGNPTGGEKDITPPVLVSASPKNNTTNFNQKEIRIYFDEYIKLKNIQKQLIVSPPFENLPDIYPQGTASKYIKIRINDTLKENTTYVFNFGQSVTDNNEGNPYSFFSYVFSTGDYIDSLNLKGHITDAFAKEADNFVSVMLYEADSTYSDSIVYKKTPKYITNTLDSLTTFELTNLKAGKYLLVAMKDQANNYKFDQKTDKIAFISDFVTIPTDSVYRLNLFKEIPNYRPAKPAQASENRIIFGYEGISDDMHIELLTDTPTDFDSRVLKDEEKDTLHYWFKPFETDSLVFAISNEREKVIDTFTVRLRELGKDTLVINPAKNNSLFQKPFAIKANIPIAAIDTSKIEVFDKDTIPLRYTYNLDEKQNEIRLKWKVDPDQKYYINALPNAIKDLYGNTNDTLNYNASTKSLSDLGSIKITLNNVSEYPVIIQLTNNNGEVKNEIYADSKQPFYEFNYQEPGKYFIRIIFDSNKNGKWDTGNYLQKIVPERIVYFPDEIELRANWEIEQSFTLE